MAQGGVDRLEEGRNDLRLVVLPVAGTNCPCFEMVENNTKDEPYSGPDEEKQFRTSRKKARCDKSNRRKEGDREKNL